MCTEQTTLRFSVDLDKRMDRGTFFSLVVIVNFSRNDAQILMTDIRCNKAAGFYV